MSLLLARLALLGALMALLGSSLCVLAAPSFRAVDFFNENPVPAFFSRAASPSVNRIDFLMKADGGVPRSEMAFIVTDLAPTAAAGAEIRVRWAQSPSRSSLGKEMLPVVRIEVAGYPAADAPNMCSQRVSLVSQKDTHSTLLSALGTRACSVPVSLLHAVANHFNRILGLKREVFSRAEEHRFCDSSPVGARVGRYRLSMMSAIAFPTNFRLPASAAAVPVAAPPLPAEWLRLATYREEPASGASKFPVDFYRSAAKPLSSQDVHVCPKLPRPEDPSLQSKLQVVRAANDDWPSIQLLVDLYGELMPAVCESGARQGHLPHADKMPLLLVLTYLGAKAACGFIDNEVHHLNRDVGETLCSNDFPPPVPEDAFSKPQSLATYAVKAKSQSLKHRCGFDLTIALPPLAPSESELGASSGPSSSNFLGSLFRAIGGRPAAASPTSSDSGGRDSMTQSAPEISPQPSPTATRERLTQSERGLIIKPQPARPRKQDSLLVPLLPPSKAADAEDYRQALDLPPSPLPADPAGLRASADRGVSPSGSPPPHPLPSAIPPPPSPSPSVPLEDLSRPGRSPSPVSDDENRPLLLPDSILPGASGSLRHRATAGRTQVIL